MCAERAGELRGKPGDGGDKSGREDVGGLSIKCEDEVTEISETGETETENRCTKK